MKMDRRKFLLNTSTAAAASPFYGAIERRASRVVAGGAGKGSTAPAIPSAAGGKLDE